MTAYPDDDDDYVNLSSNLFNSRYLAYTRWGLWLLQ